MNTPIKKVKKAIIPVAGLGTRFLPATKSIPKEMLPIVDRPILYYVIKEAAEAGIEDIVFISGRGKSSIEDFFDVSYEVQDLLKKDGKNDLLEKITEVQNMINIISVRQKEALGLGHAILCGKNIIGNDPFAVLLGDEIMISDGPQTNTTKTLCDHWEKTEKSTVAIMKVESTEVHKYGIIKGRPLNTDSDNNSSGSSKFPAKFEVLDVVEKPTAAQAPSNWALPGRYVFSAEIFNYLENTLPGKNGEIQLTDAMITLAKNSGLFAIEHPSRRFDAGDKLGFLIANIELGLEHPEIGKSLNNYLTKKYKGL